MNERAELQRKLAEAEARLEAMPRGDQVRHPHSVIARTAALQAKIVSLRTRLSTAPVHNLADLVETAIENVDSGPCLDDDAEAPAAVVHNSPQQNAQVDMAPDLHKHP